jgi:hypothetical protein
MTTRGSDPGAVALLVDQSASVVVNDTADARLFAAKYFLTFAGENTRTTLAALSSDDTTSGQLSLSPQTPVTLSPLYAAIDRTLDFVAADQQEGAKAVVVVTNGRDDTCGTRSECRGFVDALIRKSKASGVAIATVDTGDAAETTTDFEALGPLSQATAKGAAFWAPKPQQLTMVLGDLRSLLALSKDT